MLYLVIGITGLLIIVALFTFVSKSKEKQSNRSVTPVEGCCGMHAVCEKGLKIADPHIDYFEDEELDIFRGIEANRYDDRQIELFRDILYTLRKEEVEDWLISLKKRGVNLPEILNPEALDIIASIKKERRNPETGKLLL